MTPLPQPEALLPHRGSAVLLDRIVSVKRDRLIADAVVRPDMVPADAAGLVPAWAGIELMAQCVAALAGTWDREAGRPVGLGFLLGTRRYRSAVTGLRCGHTYRVVATRSTSDEEGFGVFDCAIRDGDAEIATAALTVFRPADASRHLEDPPA